MKLVASKGTHLMVAKDDLPLGDRALVLPTTDDGRVLFIVPWLGHSMIGTTDTVYTDDPTHPTASDEDNAYLIRHVRRYLDVPDFEPISSFAGLRALADPEGESTAKASRGHVVGEPVPGLVQVAGGKLTTYRKIAAEAADVVADRLDVGVKSSTDEVMLVGANGSVPSLQRRLREAGAAESVIDPSITRYGTEVMTLARLMEEDPDLAKPLGDGRTSRADVVYAVRHEAASRISDITLRRTHLAWFTRDHAREDAPVIGSIMQRELSWSDEELANQLAAHETELAAEAL
jgi:glycerol-3-phosphate dehydrogenase